MNQYSIIYLSRHSILFTNEIIESFLWVWQHLFFNKKNLIIQQKLQFNYNTFGSSIP